MVPDTLAVADYTACTTNPSGTCPSVFVYQKLLGAWTEVALLSVDDPTSTYISNVALSPDGSVIIVGSPYSGTSTNGAVYVFQKPSSGWHDMTPSAILTIPGSVGSNLGTAIGTDGNSVFATYQTDCGGISSNACVRIASYSEPSSGWADSDAPAATLSYSAEGQQVNIGNQLGVSDNYLIADLNDYPQAENLLVFADPVGGWVNATESSQISPPSGFNNSLSSFGSQLSLEGATLAVPATNGNFMILVYQEPSSGWGSMSPSAELTPPTISNEIDNLFTSSPSWVATGGTTSTSSLLYLFQEPTSGWASSNTPNQTLNIPVNSPAPNNESGARTVAMTDNAVAVGSIGQACLPELGGSLNACSLVYLYDSTALPATTDLVIQISVQGGFAEASSLTNFNITVTNQGVAPADNLQINGTLPPQLQNVQALTDQGSCQVATGTFSCNLGSLPAANTGNVSLTANAPATAQFLTQTVNWSTSSPVRSLRHTQAAVTYWVDSPPTVGNLSYTEYCCGISVQGKFAGNSPTGATLTYKVVTPPLHGQVSQTNVPAGDFIYTPTSGFVGTDSFTYIANDGYMDSKPGTVMLTFQKAPGPPSQPSNNSLARKAAGASGPFDDLFTAILLVWVRFRNSAKKKQHKSC